MLRFAPRIPPVLVAHLARIDDPAVPIAELNRRLGLRAGALGIVRPSYERVRRLVHGLRRLADVRARGIAARLCVTVRVGRFRALAEQRVAVVRLPTARASKPELRLSG